MPLPSSVIIDVAGIITWGAVVTDGTVIPATIVSFGTCAAALATIRIRVYFEEFKTLNTSILD
jgi:carbonic anhydrase/acetyltransferase-like protein (isoleucine patch superfamily)